MTGNMLPRHGVVLPHREYGRRKERNKLLAC